MYNEFEKDEFMMDEDEVETPKKKGDGWASDEEIDNPELESEDDDEVEDDEDEEEIPM